MPSTFEKKKISWVQFELERLFRFLITMNAIFLDSKNCELERKVVNFIRYVFYILAVSYLIKRLIDGAMFESKETYQNDNILLMAF